MSDLYRDVALKNGNKTIGNNNMSPTLKKAGLHSGVVRKSECNSFFTEFSKFGYIDPYSRFTNTKEVLFFTRPDLHIVDPLTGKLQDELAGMPFFMDLLEKWPNSVHELQRSWKKTLNDNPFMVSLHNGVQDTLEIPDISSADIDISTNMHGNNYEYRGSSEASDDGHTFNLEFEDTKNLDLYMMFRAYDEYERLKRLGRVTPELKYIINKILHDQISIYKFVLAEDLMTIVHYSKFIGCFPTGLPRSVFSTNDFNNGLSLTIGWKCAFVEDMNPLILSDFNIAMKTYNPSKTKTYAYMPITTPDGMRTNRAWAKGARVVERTIEGKSKYLLLFIDNNSKLTLV